VAPPVAPMVNLTLYIPTFVKSTFTVLQPTVLAADEQV
jgi:hypothetical protein